MNKANTIESKLSNYNLIKLTKYFIIAGLIISVVGSYLWYTRVFINYERRFWLAIENGMSVPSITRTLKRGGSGNQAIQTQQFHFAPQQVSVSKVVYDQKSATELTQVVTEGVSYKDAQYSRYLSFATNQKNSKGEQINLDDLLGKWEANISTEQDSESFRESYLSELVTLVILGNFDSDFRNGVLSEMKQKGVYEINYADLNEFEEEGRKLIVYPVSVEARPFVELLLKSFGQAGLGGFSSLDPTSFPEDAEPLAVQIVVDKQSNQIAKVVFGSREEIYSGHGIVRQIDRPEGTYGSGELEQKVNERLFETL